VRISGREEGKATITQRRREEEEKGLVVACRGMGTLPMTFHGRDARATWKAVRLPAAAGFFPPIGEGLRFWGDVSVVGGKVVGGRTIRAAAGRNVKPQSSPRLETNEPTVVFIILSASSALCRVSSSGRRGTTFWAKNLEMGIPRGRSLACG
jgi:hypothetical protein